MKSKVSCHLLNRFSSPNWCKKLLAKNLEKLSGHAMLQLVFLNFADSGLFVSGFCLNNTNL